MGGRRAARIGELEPAHLLGGLSFQGAVAERHHKALLFMIPLIPLAWIVFVVWVHLRGSAARWPLVAVFVAAIVVDLGYVVRLATRSRQERR